MGIQSINSRNLVEEVYEQMKQNIMDGEWVANGKIPSENELSSLFKVSRNTVRSAIQKLATLGILIAKQGQGTFVCEDVHNSIVNSFFPVLNFSKEEIIDVLEFRKTIEMESVRLAAERADSKDIQRIKKNLDAMIDNLGDSIKYSVADFLFHENIARASKNRIFYKSMVKLEDIIYRHLEQLHQEFGGELSIEMHRKIYLAIESRNPDLARSLMGENIQIGIDALNRERNN